MNRAGGRPSGLEELFKGSDRTGIGADTQGGRQRVEQAWVDLGTTGLEAFLEIGGLAGLPTDQQGSQGSTQGGGGGQGQDGFQHRAHRLAEIL